MINNNQWNVCLHIILEIRSRVWYLIGYPFVSRIFHFESNNGNRNNASNLDQISIVFFSRRKTKKLITYMPIHWKTNTSRSFHSLFPSTINTRSNCPTKHIHHSFLYIHQQSLLLHRFKESDLIIMGKIVNYFVFFLAIICVSGLLQQGMVE